MPSLHDGLHATDLPAATLAHLQDLFNADLGTVRVHLATSASAVAYTEGSDVHIRPDAYRPDHPDGLEILGHEIAHVLQQRHGRVRPTCVRDGVPENHDHELEREAIAAGRDIARGRPVRIPGRPAGLGTAVRQHYQTVPPANRVANNVVVPAAPAPAPTVPLSAFVHQEKGAPGGPAQSSFLVAGTTQPNLVVTSPANVVLRVSANGQMAIEDADLSTHQPKVFYATQAVVTRSNDRLQLFGSTFQLVPDPPGANQRTITIAGQVLYRITPRNVPGNTAGFTMDAMQYCNQLVDQVLGGSGVDGPEPTFERPLTRAPGGAGLVEYHVARALLPAPQPAVVDMTSAVTQATTMTAITVPYATAARAPAGQFQTDIQTYGINQYAKPSVGEAFATFGMFVLPAGGAVGQNSSVLDHYHPVGGAPAVLDRPRTWQSHFAGVVAEDGGDVVTLENYARSQEDVHSGGTDSRYYFQMYDASPAGIVAGRSWHAVWTSTPMVPVPAPAAAPPPAAPAAPGAVVYPPATQQPASPGARSYANPISFRLSVPDARLNQIAAGLYPAANVDAIKDTHNAIAAATAAGPDQEIRAVLRGLRFANVRIAANATDTSARLNSWLNALTQAFHTAAHPSNRRTIDYTLSRIAQVRRG